MTRLTSTKEGVLLESLLRGIQAARLRPGARLPVERDQMLEFGVSRTTVRRALGRLEVAGLIERRHGSGTFLRQAITEAVIQKLLDAEEGLSRVGRRLVTQETHRIAVLHDTRPDNPVFAMVLKGIMDYGRSRGHTIATGVSRPPFSGKAPDEFSPEVFTTDADGLIISATFRPGDQHRLARLRVPYVLLTDHPSANAISLDIHAACRQGIEELVSLGHRRIAVVEKSYVPKPPTLAHVCDHVRADWPLPALVHHFGEDPIAAALSQAAAPTALLVTDDVYCRRVAQELSRRGLRAGRDVDVLSFSNRGLDSRLPATIGRIEFDLEELGRLAGQAIERQLGDGTSKSSHPPIRVGGLYVPAKRSMALTV